MADLGLKGFSSRAFLDGLWFNGVPCGEMWHEGRKLYPDDRTRVKDLVLELPKDAYWLHAVDAVEKLGASEECYVKVELGGHVWMLYASFGGHALLRAVDGVFRFGEDDGVLLQDCEVGAVARVSAVVPEREGEGFRSERRDDPDYFEDHVWGLPMLKGTWVTVSGYKGKKREHAYVNHVCVTGLPSGKVWVREESRRWTQKGRPHVKLSLELDAETVLSDSSWRGRVNCYGSFGWDRGMFPVYPAFERVWECRVLGVTLWRN